jgi:hypothetical protein
VDAIPGFVVESGSEMFAPLLEFILAYFFTPTFPAVWKNTATVLVFKKATEPLLVIIGLLPFSVFS